MKKLGILLVCFLLPTLQWAQDTDELPENDQIRAQRAAYITQRLHLTTTEATYFWSVYNEYEVERRKLFQQFANTRQLPSSEAQAAALIEQRLELEADLLALKRRYYQRLRGQVPASKLVDLPDAEREFKRDLLRQLQQRRLPNRGG